MARVIVLSFDDNEAAEAFARVAMSDDQPYQVQALIARPTVGCPGPHRVPGKMKPERGFSRTKRFGWFVCGTCNRPAKTVVKNFIINMLGGSNNLLPELTGGEPKQPPWVKETLQAIQLQASRG